MKIKRTFSQTAFNVVGYLVTGIIGMLCLLPSLMKMYVEYGIFYRKDLAKKYGFDEIKDYETMESYTDCQPPVKQMSTARFPLQLPWRPHGEKLPAFWRT